MSNPKLPTMIVTGFPAPSGNVPVTFSEQRVASECRWKVSANFQVGVQLNPQLMGVQCAPYEYRQYIKGDVWLREWIGDKPVPTPHDPGNEGWFQVDAGTIEDRKKTFQIPRYAGLKSTLSGLPTTPVNSVGLSSAWKEDGIIRNGIPMPYGYRSSAYSNGDSNEQDTWRTGHKYELADTVSIGGTWRDSVVVLSQPLGRVNWIEVWIEIHFRGYVVELNAPGGTPMKVIARKEWSVIKNNQAWWKRTLY